MSYDDHEKTVNQALAKDLGDPTIARTLILSVATIIVVILISLIVTSITSTIADWNHHNHQLDIKALELENQRILAEEQMRLDAEIRMAQMEVRKQEALAAINPYRALAESPEPHDHIFGDVDDADMFQPVRVNGTRFSSQQRNLLTLAYHIGGEVEFPETVQALLMQETLAGKLGNRIGDTVLPPLRRSYGVTQVKVQTARHVMQLFPEIIPQYFPGHTTESNLRDEEIIIKLITDDVFAIRTAALFFSYLRRNTDSWARAVVAYNQGLSRARQIQDPTNHPYYLKVVERINDQIRPFNIHVGLSLPPNK
jgi:hypothetical protein